MFTLDDDGKRQEVEYMHEMGYGPGVMPHVFCGNTNSNTVA